MKLYVLILLIFLTKLGCAQSNYSKTSFDRYKFIIKHSDTTVVLLGDKSVCFYYLKSNTAQYYESTGGLIQNMLNDGDSIYVAINQISSIDQVRLTGYMNGFDSVKHWSTDAGISSVYFNIFDLKRNKLNQYVTIGSFGSQLFIKKYGTNNLGALPTSEPYLVFEGPNISQTNSSLVITNGNNIMVSDGIGHIGKILDASKTFSWSKNIVVPNHHWLKHVEGKIYYIGSNQQKGSVMELDTNGNCLWAKHYSLPTNAMVINNVIRHKDSLYFVGDLFPQSVLIKTDTLGNIGSSYKIGRSDISVHDPNIRIVNDSLGIYITSRDSLGYKFSYIMTFDPRSPIQCSIEKTNVTETIYQPSLTPYQFTTYTNTTINWFSTYGKYANGYILQNLPLLPFCNIASVSDVQFLPSLRLYPNPTLDQTTVVTDCKRCELTIYDNKGRKVLELNSSEVTTISTDGMTPGVYAVVLKDLDQPKYISCKLIKY